MKRILCRLLGHQWRDDILVSDMGTPQMEMYPVRYCERCRRQGLPLDSRPGEPL